MQLFLVATLNSCSCRWREICLWWLSSYFSLSYVTCWEGTRLPSLCNSWQTFACLQPLPVFRSSFPFRVLSFPFPLNQSRPMFNLFIALAGFPIIFLPIIVHEATMFKNMPKPAIFPSPDGTRCFRFHLLVAVQQNFDKLYSPQMVVTANTTKYTIENDLTKKEKTKKTNKQTQTNGMYLS